MNCYDCPAQHDSGVAVAVCSRCGAGLCRDHVHVAPQTVHEAAGTGVYTHTPDARRLTCSVCHEAEV